MNLNENRRPHPIPLPEREGVRTDFAPRARFSTHLSHKYGVSAAQARSPSIYVTSGRAITSSICRFTAGASINAHDEKSVDAVTSRRYSRHGPFIQSTIGVLKPILLV